MTPSPSPLSPLGRGAGSEDCLPFRETASSTHGGGHVLWAVLPGLALSGLHMTALDLPRADVIAALDSDRYRIQWIVGAYLVGSAAGMALTRFVCDRLGMRWAYLLALALFAAAAGGCAAVSEVIAM